MKHATQNTGCKIEHLVDLAIPEWHKKETLKRLKTSKKDDFTPWSTAKQQLKSILDFGDSGERQSGKKTGALERSLASFLKPLHQKFSLEIFVIQKKSVSLHPD